MLTCSCLNRIATVPKYIAAVPQCIATIPQCTSTITTRYRSYSNTSTTNKKPTNLYDVLNVTPKCSQKKIKASYYKLCLLYHPDQNADTPENLQKYSEVNEAYEILSDPIAKKRYDIGQLVYSPSSGATTVREMSDIVLDKHSVAKEAKRYDERSKQTAMKSRDVETIRKRTKQKRIDDFEEARRQKDDSPFIIACIIPVGVILCFYVWFNRDI